MNISDYFKAKPDKPIDALIEELLKDNSNSVSIKYTTNRNDTDALIDDILDKDNSLPINE